MKNSSENSIDNEKSLTQLPMFKTKSIGACDDQSAKKTTPQLLSVFKTPSLLKHA